MHRTRPTPASLLCHTSLAALLLALAVHSDSRAAAPPASRHAIDPKRIAALGSPAGGHLASLLGTTAHRRDLEGNGGHAGHSSRVQLVVAYYPVTDLGSLGKGYFHTLVLKNLLGRL